MKRKHIRVRKKRNLNEIMLGRGVFKENPIPGSLPYALKHTILLPGATPPSPKKRRR